jgi:methylenetetrahydrofolate dehydrogenase (NADP+)/methenyltetrahydrofolate cyclohydrolase
LDWLRLLNIQVGFHSIDVELPEDVSQDELIKRIDELNNDDKVHGILVQLPLPGHISVCCKCLLIG